MQNCETVGGVARAICRERCAAYGDPPCWKVGYPVEACPDDETCLDIAKAAIDAMENEHG